MDKILEILKTDQFLLITAILLILFLIIIIILICKLFSINKKYRKFLNKLGHNENIKEDLENFMHIVDRVEKQNLEIMTNLKTMEKEIAKSVKKIGMIRYSAFKDTGSDLSFALALLDENNNGILLNGIYSREMSNIYAKEIKEGKSQVALSDEEQQAVEKAVTDTLIHKIIE